jgi:hypothetical protein
MSVLSENSTEQKNLGLFLNRGARFWLQESVGSFSFFTTDLKKPNLSWSFQIRRGLENRSQKFSVSFFRFAKFPRRGDLFLRLDIWPAEARM